MVRTAVFQAANAGSIPAGNAIRGCSSVDRAIALQAKDAGLNPAVSTNSSRCSAEGQRAWFGTTRPQVRILPARPDDSPVAQRTKERAVTTREAEGSNPSWGASIAGIAQSESTTLPASGREFESRCLLQFDFGAVTQKKECLPVEEEVAGSSPAGAANGA